MRKTGYLSLYQEREISLSAFTIQHLDQKQKYKLSEFIAGVLETPDSVVLRMKTEVTGQGKQDKTIYSEEFLSAGFLVGNIAYIRVNKASARQETYTIIYTDGTFEIWDAIDTRSSWRKGMENEIKRCIEEDLGLSLTDRN